MPNLRNKTWTTTTPATVGDAQYWEDHLISDEAAAKAAGAVQSVNNTLPDENGNINITPSPLGPTVIDSLNSTSATDALSANMGHELNENKQDTLTFDNVPTKNSANPVKSGGIYDDITDVYGVMGENGTKNKLKFISGYVNSGITTTVGSDGIVTCSGTISAGQINFRLLTAGNYMLPVGKYKVSVEGTFAHPIYVSFAPTTGNWQTKAIISQSGQEAEFEVTSSDLDKTLAVFSPECTAGETINYSIKPMIRDARDTNPDFEPYAMTNRELTERCVLREHTYTGTSDANGVVVASTVPHRPIVYCYGAPEGGGNVFVEARPGGGGIAFYCHNNGTKVASTEITIHYFDYQD